MRLGRNINMLDHILIIDDDQINNLFSQIILEDANACGLVSICHSVTEAMDFLRTVSINDDSPFPDLILLDISMPSLDGFDFLDRYHLSGYHEKYKTMISMFTSSHDSEHVEKSKQYNSVIGFINKPLSINSLNNILSFQC
jgi:two-component system, CitB family, response regulator MalR